MICSLALINALILSFTFTIYGQGSIPIRKTSLQDSILLNKFWKDFVSAINTNDKLKLARLCKFPFYCRPCIDDTTLKLNDQVTIKVTKKVFNDSQYKIFFDSPIKNEVNKHLKFDLYFFNISPDNKNNAEQSGFNFSYTIIAPSKYYEGSQGFIFLKKIGGTYKITGIDTVP